MDEAKAKAEHDAAVARGENPPPVEAEPELVSRAVQGGIGLFTGVTVYNVAFGGLFALAFAICYGRMGDCSPRVTSALIALSGFVAVYAVPILKYPANPPSIGNPDTIGMRTAIYFGMMLLSLASMIAAWNVRNRLVDQHGAWNATLIGAAVYIVAVVMIAFAMPPAERGSRRLPRRGPLAVPHGLARRAGDHVDGDRARLRGLGRARFRAGEAGQAADGLSTGAWLSMTARLDLLAHGASAATRAARFPDDEALEASAVAPSKRSAAGCKDLRSRSDRARSRRARDGLGAGPRRRRRDGACGIATTGAGAVSPLKDVAAREPDGFAAWLGDPAAAPHGGESLAALILRVSVWLAESLARDGATLAVTHASVVRAAIVGALGAGSSAFWRIDVAATLACQTQRSRRDAGIWWRSRPWERSREAPAGRSRYGPRRAWDVAERSASDRCDAAGRLRTASLFRASRTARWR